MAVFFIVYILCFVLNVFWVFLMCLIFSKSMKFITQISLKKTPLIFTPGEFFVFTELTA